MAIALILAAVLTCVIELPIIYFSFKKEQCPKLVSNIILINLITNLTLNILNIFIPHKVLSESFRATLMALKKRVRVRYILLLFTWQIFWAISGIMMTIALILPTNCTIDLFMPLFVVRILFNLTYITTIILTLMVVTILYRMQSKRLALFR